MNYNFCYSWVNNILFWYFWLYIYYTEKWITENMIKDLFYSYVFIIVVGTLSLTIICTNFSSLSGKLLKYWYFKKQRYGRLSLNSSIHNQQLRRWLTWTTKSSFKMGVRWIFLTQSWDMYSSKTTIWEVLIIKI